MPDESPHPVLFIYQQVALIRARQRRLPIHSLQKAKHDPNCSG
jgi:hypothetical protein